MELDQICKICNDNVVCQMCSLYDTDNFRCTLYFNPNNWDIEEIKRRLENYGKKENGET